jgi:putative ABC transport system permease protein
MSVLSRLRSWWRACHDRARFDRQLREELEFHVDRCAEDLMRDGLSPDAARQRARAALGSIPATREDVRAALGLRLGDEIRGDLRYALRTLRRAPAFTAVALLTLALGIGANTAIFSIVNGVLLRPLDYPRPEQLMYVTTQFSGLGLRQFHVSAPEYLELREVNQSFAAMGAFSPGAGEVNLTAPGGARRVRNANVNEHLLDALGLQAAQGRLFARGETDRTDPEAPLPPIVILSHELWQTAFGGQPIIGKLVEVNSRRREVIGIMPPGADVLDIRPEIWLPLGLNPSNRGNRLAHGLRVIGRLKDDVTPEAAQKELTTLNEQWGERVGVSDHMFAPSTGHILQMVPLHDQIVSGARRAIWMLQATAGLVLLIACANLANLLLARAAIRRREFAVRTALGASRRRLLRQFMTEGALLSIACSALGVWLAHFGLRTLTQAYPGALPRSTEVSVDLPVLLFACGVAIATTMFFGLAQLRHIGVKDLGVTLTDAGSKGASGGTRRHVRRGLVMAEVAVAVILVIGAGLLIRTVYNLTNVDLGFNRSRLVTFSINLPESTYPGPLIRVQAFQRLLDALRAVPGVEAATAMAGLPPNRPPFKITTNVADATVSSPSTPALGPVQIVDYYQYVLNDYFETMGIPIVRGRSFQPTDATSSGFVAIVNEKFAETFWKGRDPIGQRVKPCCNDQPPWFTVVGVAKDVKQGGVDQETGTELYLAVPQIAKPAPGLGIAPLNHVVLRTTLAATALSQTVKRVVHEMDPTVPVVHFRDMETVVAESIQRPRFLAQLLGLFAGLALLLAAVGTYGVLSYLVAERRTEISIRMALGADRSSVLVHVMREGLLLTGIGVVVGLAGAFGLSRLIASLLFGVTPTDVPTVAGVTATMIIVAAVACLLPAWRASRLDPNAVLRV